MREKVEVSTQWWRRLWLMAWGHHIAHCCCLTRQLWDGGKDKTRIFGNKNRYISGSKNKSLRSRKCFSPVTTTCFPGHKSVFFRSVRVFWGRKDVFLGHKSVFFWSQGRFFRSQKHVFPVTRTCFSSPQKCTVYFTTKKRVLTVT